MYVVICRFLAEERLCTEDVIGLEFQFSLELDEDDDDDDESSERFMMLFGMSKPAGGPSLPFCIRVAGVTGLELRLELSEDSW